MIQKIKLKNMYDITDVKICTSMINNPDDGSVYYDYNTNELFIAKKKSWLLSTVFDTQERDRQNLRKIRKEKLNKLNETR